MNPNAILALIADLYEQASLQQRRIEELEAQVAALGGDAASNGDKSPTTETARSS